MNITVNLKDSALGKNGFNVFDLYINGLFYGRVLQSLSSKVPSEFILEAWPNYRKYSPVYFSFNYIVNESLNDLQMRIISKLIEWKPEWFE